MSKLKNIKVYDIIIKNATERYLPLTYDWRLLKAQYMAESGLNCSAVSPVGARGIAQFMPATWEEMRKKMGLDVSNPCNAHDAIHTGAFYMARLLKEWNPDTRSIKDRQALAIASYNAGLGNILKAQSKAKNAADYKTIIAALHLVTGNNNASETRNYVKRIFEYYEELLDEDSLLHVQND